MAATTAAVVAEEDTELRDLLVQTLENSGVLNRIKAELRAAVFLALEEQEKVENKSPLVNESLKKFLNTKDGRLVASLVAEFLQFFNLDFTLAVFHPETSTFQGLEGRENLARDLGIIEAEGTVGGPLLLEVIRRCQQKEKGPTSGEGALDLSDGHPPSKSLEGKLSTNSTPSKIPRYKGQGKKKTSGQKSGDKKTSSETSQSEPSISLSESKSKSSPHSVAHETRIASFLSSSPLDAKDKSALCPDEDDAEGDSFFDDPIPKPEKTYGWRSEPRKQMGNLASLSDIPPLRSALSSLAGAPSLTDTESKRGSTVLKDLKLVGEKIGSLGLGTGEDEEYVDDFNSASHRSEKSELSIGEEIEEDLSVGVDDVNTSDKAQKQFELLSKTLQRIISTGDGIHVRGDPSQSNQERERISIQMGKKGIKLPLFPASLIKTHIKYKGVHLKALELINRLSKLDDLTQDLTVSQLSDVADYLEDVA